LFLLSAEKLRVAPTSCIVIEDSVNGVKAGVAAGMTVWGFVGGPHCLPNQSGRLSDAGAARVMRRMVEIAEALQRLTGGD
jgi:beta-phosphoglucomutase-like phosphatase (HAD superfamily)